MHPHLQPFRLVEYSQRMIEANQAFVRAQRNCDIYRLLRPHVL